MRSPRGIVAQAATIALCDSLASCGGPADTTPGNGTGGEPGLGEEFAVEEGRGIVLAGGDLEVRFEGVESEGRCPEEPGLSLRVRKRGEEPTVLSFHTSGARYPSEAGYLDYEVRLPALDPCPRSLDDEGIAPCATTVGLSRPRVARSPPR